MMKGKEKRGKESPSAENPNGLSFKDYISEKMRAVEGRDGKAHTSSADLAEALGLSTKVLQEILNGRRGRPDRRDLVIAICAELALDASETNEALSLYPGFLHKLANDDARDREITKFLNAGFDSEISYKALDSYLTKQGLPGLKTRHRNPAQKIWKRKRTKETNNRSEHAATIEKQGGSDKPNKKVDAAAFKKSILNAYAALKANEKTINDLNVFPVPDGDTGTNMCLTMKGAVSELEKNQYETITTISDGVASSLLRAARGNSGVILSLLFRGISSKLKGLQEADPKSITAAMQEGVKAAYKAVMKPVEGTILTVSRIASAAAVKAAKHGADLEKTFEAAIAAGESALEDTVNVNPVLSKAGVVDAGGMGYIVILKAILDSMRGKSFVPQEKVDIICDTDYDPRENITFTYDTVYIVHKSNPDANLEPLREYLISVGDSLIINEDNKIFKVHVHTDDPGAVLTESLKYGALEVANIENMVLQAQKESEKKVQPAKPEKRYGVVAVAAGEGMKQLFRDLGADRIVTGGQTMNPSTDDILHEINQTPAETVFVLPNNKNIIMTAEAAVDLCKDKRVIIIPTKTMPQGVSALINFNADDEENQLVKNMSNTISNVHTAMVTKAARDSDFDGNQIHEGEFLALLDGALCGSCSNEEMLLKKMELAFMEFNPEYITIYYGQDVSEKNARRVVEAVGSKFPEVELNIVNGGQPVYHYMISVE